MNEVEYQHLKSLCDNAGVHLPKDNVCRGYIANAPAWLRLYFQKEHSNRCRRKINKMGANKLARKYKATYPSGRTKVVLAENIDKARDKLFTQDGKLNYRTLERVNPLKPRRKK